MGLLDGVINALGGQSGIAGDIEAIAGHFGGAGVQTIVTQFEQGGMGTVIQSWISSGVNLPISQDQLQAVLGSDAVTKMSAALGIDPSQLSNALPEVINHLTPNGQLPAGGIGDELTQALSSGSLGNILSGFMKPANA
ncbi:MAG TPA: YidB family protein [Asticcacaulis sp.]|nr:YidB family protein [Asticcacaulis sp.]